MPQLDSKQTEIITVQCKHTAYHMQIITLKMNSIHIALDDKIVQNFGTMI